MTTAIDLETTELLAALRAQARGTHTDEAAVELLAAHDSWLRRRDFRRLVDYTDDPDVTGGPPMAVIRWADVATDRVSLTGSSTERAVLLVAESLVTGAPTDLRRIVADLGEHTTGLVMRAIAHAAGHGPRIDITIRYGQRFDPDADTGWTTPAPDTV